MSAGMWRYGRGQSPPALALLLLLLRLCCCAGSAATTLSGAGDRPGQGKRRPRNSPTRCSSVVEEAASTCNRRAALASLAVTLTASTVTAARAASLPPAEEKSIKLCDADCEANLKSKDYVTTESGLQYKDLREGSGPSPRVGFQVAADYVAQLPDGKVFDSSLEKGVPYIFRVGSGQVISGLDEGILTMKAGGTRRLYIPGPLAFPKGLSAAAGRPRVPPSSPVVFDVSLLYIPGLSEREEDEREEVASAASAES